MDGTKCAPNEHVAKRPETPGVRALYLHIPFCVQKCAYCDFASRATEREDGLPAAYASALEGQVAEVRDLGMLRSCETAYLGGGTPTFLGWRALGSLVRMVRRSAPSLVELTCEANPESLGDEVLDSLVRERATRISIGVQSLDDRELAALGRAHDARLARERVRAAVGAGLDVSVDLMCAIPLQSDESWEETVGGALALEVGHVSVYPLQIEDGTPLGLLVGDSEPAWNDPEVQAERMEAAARLLGAAGLMRYEVASYALPGKACRHNEAYWTGRRYLGLGEGASSMLDRACYELLRHGPCPQLPELPADAARARLTVTTEAAEMAASSSLGALSFDLEFLDEGQAAAEDLMLAMRRTGGADAGLIARCRRALGAGRVDRAISDVVERGLAGWRDGSLLPTHRGWLLGNELYGTFWGLAEGPVRIASC